MDLNAPLGLEPPARRRRPFGLVAAGIAGAGILGLCAYYLASADPHGGEPFAVATIPPAPAAKVQPPAGNVDPMPTGSTPPSPDTDGVRIEHGVKVHGASSLERPVAISPTPLVIDVSKVLDARGRAPGQGSGTSSSRATRPSAGSDAARPRIAILVGGLGLSADATQAAIETLPPAVDLAFVPYGATLTATVASARAKGHEIFLQLPMQSAQGSLPGEHTLRSSEPATELATDVTWLMSRFDGYAGVTNLLGAPVTANQAAMSGVLKAVASRGLPYVDDGTSRRSLASKLAAGMNLPAAQADVVLDATGDQAVVDANLERLMTVARAKGSAIGSANALSDHLGSIARFARQLDARGFALVPVTAVVRGGSNVAANR